MYKVYLTVDPSTGRALYRDEEKFMGSFESILAAAKALGDSILNFCSFRTEKGA